MATYYWVGGDGTWDASSTANWALASGGVPGIAAPNNTDTVIFDSASGTGTCTTASGSACATATLNTSTLGLTLGANHTMSGTFTLTLGTLSLGSFTLSCNIFNTSNLNIRSIAFGTGNITLTGNATTIWTTSTVTNFSYTGTPTINCTYSGSVGQRAIFTSATTLESQALNFNISAGSDSITSLGVCKNLDFTGFSGTFLHTGRVIFGNLTFSAGMTVNGGASVTTFAATSGVQQVTTNGVTLDHPITQNSPGATLQLQDNLTMGSTRAFTLTAGTLDLTGNSGNWTLSTGIFTSSNTNTRSILFGTGNITLTGNNATVVNFGNNAGLTVTGTPVMNLTYSGSTGTRTITYGTASGSEARSISMNITAGSDAVAITNSSNIRGLNFTGFSGSLSNGTRILYGDVIFSSGMTQAAGTLATSFGATSGAQKITTNNQTIDYPLDFIGNGGTIEFQDALTQTSTRNFTFQRGTIQLKAGVTSTVGSFVTLTTTQKFLQSTLAGSQATLSQASGTVNVADLTIRDINAVGGAAWNAYTDFENTDAGNNDGWNFSLSPPYTTAELPITLRSFTQPRRF
jgi:hypothetical protein